MTYKHYNAFLDASPPFDSGMQRALFLEACTRADNAGIIRLSQTELANLALFSRVTIAKEFVRLQALGLLEKVAHGKYKVILAHSFDVADTPASQTTKESHPPAEEDSELKTWIISEYGAKAFESGQITVSDNANTYEDMAKDAEKQGIFQRVKSGFATDGKFYRTYQFDPSSV